MGGVFNPVTPEAIGAVPDDRQVLAGQNMSGGGDLSNDVVMNSLSGGGTDLIAFADVGGLTEINIPIDPTQDIGAIRIFVSARSNDVTQFDLMRMQMNNDTTAVYDSAYSQTGSIADEVQSFGQTSMIVGATVTSSAPSIAYSVTEITIFDVSSTTASINFHSESSLNLGTPNFLLVGAGGEYKVGAALTNIRLFLDSGDTFVAGSTVQVMGYNTTGGGGIVVEQELLVEDRKPNNSSGGSTSATSFNTRPLVERFNTIPGATVVGSTIKLPAGVYTVDGHSVAYRTGANKAQIQGVNNPFTDFVIGSSGYSDSSSDAQSISILRDTFQLIAETEIELNHYTQLGFAGQGLGVAAGNGTDEVYASLKFIKLI